jgi:hypothetical protein
MGLPDGTEYIVPVTVNKSRVSDNLSNFSYHLNLSSRFVADKTWYNSFDPTNPAFSSVAVYDQETDTVLHSYNYFSADTYIVRFNGPAFKSKDKTFLLCHGKAINCPPDSKSHTDSGYTLYLPFDTSLTAGVVGSLDSSTGVSLSDGKFYKGAYSNAVAGNNLYKAGCLMCEGAASFEVLFYATSATAKRLFEGDSVTPIYIILDSTLVLTYKTLSGVSPVCTSGAFELNTWNHLVMNRSLDNKVNFYLNGVISGAADQDAGPDPAQAQNTYILNRQDGERSYAGYIDEMGVCNKTLSLDFIKTRYQMFFASDFYTLGSGYLPSTFTETISVAISGTKL